MINLSIAEVIVACSSWNPEKEAPEQEFNYIDLSSVEQNTKSITEARTVTGAEAPSRARQLVSSSDILVSTVRPNLNGVALVPVGLDGATASTGFCVLRCDPSKMDPQFLFQWVKTPDFVREMIRRSTGANYPAVSDRIIKESRIPIPFKDGKPDLAEQKRIAAILDKADGIRRKRQQALRLADDFLRSVFLDMFGDPVNNSKGWHVADLGAVADVLTGYAFKSSEYLGKCEGLPLCRGINIGVGKIDWKERVDWPSVYESNLGRYEISKGDILLAMDRPWISSGLKVAIASDSDIPSLLVQRVARIRADKGMSAVIYFLLNHEVFTRHCKPTETTIPHISPTELKAFKIPELPTGLLDAFSKIEKGVGRKKNHMRKQVEQSEVLFASLQQRAFRGEL